MEFDEQVLLRGGTVEIFFNNDQSHYHLHILINLSILHSFYTLDRLGAMETFCPVVSSLKMMLQKWFTF